MKYEEYNKLEHIKVLALHLHLRNFVDQVAISLAENISLKVGTAIAAWESWNHLGNNSTCNIST